MTETLDTKITKTTHSRLAETDFNNLQFGHTFSDHMFVADYVDGEWKNFQIVRVLSYAGPPTAPPPGEPALPRQPPGDHRPDHLRRIQPPGQHERRKQRCVTRHRPHRSRGTNLPAASRYADMPPVARPEHHRNPARRAVRPRELHPRPAATYASTASGHGHTMATGDTASDPSPRPWPNEGEEGSLTSKRGRQNPGPPQRPGSSIVKEHGRASGRDAQEVRPSTIGVGRLLRARRLGFRLAWGGHDFHVFPFHCSATVATKTFWELVAPPTAHTSLALPGTADTALSSMPFPAEDNGMLTCFQLVPSQRKARGTGVLLDWARYPDGPHVGGRCRCHSEHKPDQN